MTRTSTFAATLGALVIALPLSFAAASPAAAGQAPAYDYTYAPSYNDWQGYWAWQHFQKPLAPHRIIHRLKRQGFFHVEDLVLVGQRYRATATNSHGQPVRLRIDAYTGEVLKVRVLAAEILPFSSIAKHLSHQGYSHIRSRGLEHGSHVYVVTAVNPWGHRVRLRIDGYTGQVIA